MKKLSSLLLLLVLGACSSSGNKETDQNSVAAASDTTVAETVASSESIEENATTMTGDTSQLEITFDETAGLVFERMEPFYTVSIVTKQYEAASDVTWYFDTGFSPIYFKETAASEGTEGSVEYFIKNGDVKCAYVNESYGEGGSTEKWCNATGGTLKRFDVGVTELLPEAISKNYNTNLTRYLSVLREILKEAEITEEVDDSMTLRIDKMLKIGEEEFPGSTEVTIPKKVYQELIK